jgi:hypothetical protein
MMFRPSDRTALSMADLRLANADVTLQEVSRVNLAMLPPCIPLVCDAHSVGAVAVPSRTPLLYETCARALGFASVMHAGQARSVHLHYMAAFATRPPLL